MITHKTSTVPVYQSEDYALFAMMKGNRVLNLNKIGRIIKDIEAGNNMLPYYPIQVRPEENKLIILDGQHRFYICKKLKKPVHYILVTEQKSMHDIAKINSNVDKWKSADFINCYTTAGVNDYAILNEFLQAFGFSLGVCLSLLTEGEPGKQNGSVPELYNDFTNGKFKISKLQEAKDFGEICKKFSAFKNWRSRAFIIAINKIIKAKKISIEDVVEAFNRYPSMLKEQANYKDYIVNLEQIINVGKKIRIVIA